MRNELKVGLLGIVTLLLLIFGYKYLKGSNVFERNRTYYIKFQDVGQMDASSPVITRGLKVGTVIKVELDPNDPNMVLVTIEVKSEIQLPQETKAVLVQQGLMGGKAIILQYSKYCEKDCLPNHSFIKGEIAGMLSSMISKDEVKEYTQTVGNELNAILDTSSSNKNVQIAGTVKNIHLILDNLAKSTILLQHLLSSTSKSMENSLSNLEVLTASLSKNANAIGQSLQNMEAITKSLKQADPGKLVTTTEQTLSESKKTFQTLNETLDESKKSVQKLNNILTDLNAGNGSLGKLLKDPVLYQNLSKSSKDLDLLLQDLRLNPKRYLHFSVFGGKGEKYATPDTTNPK